MFLKTMYPTIKSFFTWEKFNFLYKNDLWYAIEENVYY